MIIENGTINGNTISINPELENNIFLPSMYKPWLGESTQHIQFKLENTDSVPLQNRILFIFDTWGCSSYYHLLIDHIIPVWITKEFVNKYLFEQNIFIPEMQEEYFRISTNNYHHELKNVNDIFKYFLGKHFTEQINGKFKYIVYGYCNYYRPYHGNKINYYLNYQTMLDKFLLTFAKNAGRVAVFSGETKYEFHRLNGKINDDSTMSIDGLNGSENSIHSKQGQYILLTKRVDRNFVDLDDIFFKLKAFYNVKIVDFSEYSIKEQIELCNNAYAMIGSEGAAFSNQIFMKPGSLLISFCQNPTQNNFHTSLTQYLKHDFRSIMINNSYSQNDIINDIIDIINSPRIPLQIPFTAIPHIL